MAPPPHLNGLETFSMSENRATLGSSNIFLLLKNSIKLSKVESEKFHSKHFPSFGNLNWTSTSRGNKAGQSHGLDNLETVRVVWNQGRFSEHIPSFEKLNWTFGTSIPTFTLFSNLNWTSTSKVNMAGQCHGLDNLETVKGVWNKDRPFKVQFPTFFFIWKIQLCIWFHSKSSWTMWTIWTVWKRSEVSGTMPEVSEIQFWSFSFF